MIGCEQMAGQVIPTENTQDKGCLAMFSTAGSQVSKQLEQQRASKRAQ